MPEKRCLSVSNDAPEKTLSGNIQQRIEKRPKVESPTISRSNTSTVTASSNSASNSIGDKIEEKSQLQTPSPSIPQTGDVQKPSSCSVKSANRNTNATKGIIIQPKSQTQTVTLQSSQIAAASQTPNNPAVAIKKECSASNPTPRLSNDICNRDRSTNLSVSTLSSSDSSGRKEVSSLSSGSAISVPSNPTPISGTRPPATLAESGTTFTQTNLGEKKPTPPPPLKSTKMAHLRKKYMGQLEYMHREFKKLERQLLGAKTTARNLTESEGSRERREKLHNFIVHLEETMNQIQVGCSLEHEGKSTLGVAITSGGLAVSGGGGASSQRGSSALESNETSQADEEAAKKEFARSSALTKLTKEKEEEENVQKLEEHILANLLPVKERLTKQLAAQQGAAKNPAGMPTRRGLQPPGAATKMRPHMANSDRGSCHTTQGSNGARSPINPPSEGPVTGPTTHSQFGQPLQGGGSSLTQKLHGKTLGSQQRPPSNSIDRSGKGINSARVDQKSSTNVTPRKVIYAGMTPGSKQVKSGVSAASGVHEMVIENERHKIGKGVAVPKAAVTAPPPPPPANNIIAPRVKPVTKLKPVVGQSRQPTGIQIPTKKTVQPITVTSTSVPPPPPPGLSMTVLPRPNKNSQDSNLTEEERQIRMAKKKSRKVEKQERQRQILLHQQQQQLQRQPQASSRRVIKPASSVVRSVSGQRKGPRSVEYICALCNEAYKSSSEYNPWWALTSHECVKCGKTQIPRLDISAPANAIEYHPALLAHAATDDAGKNSNKAVSVSAIPKQYSRSPHDVTINGNMKPGTYTHLNGDDGDLSGSDDSEFGDDMSPAAQAENEDFGKNYSGPTFSDHDASRLLLLMAHASTCPGKHKSSKASNCCNNIKFMMLHVRDCAGTTSSDDICPFPWCRKTKHLLYHLVSCPSPDKCQICSPSNISRNFRAMQGLNNFRLKKRREQNAAALSSISNAASKFENGKVNAINQLTNSSISKKIGQRRMARNGSMAVGARANRSAKVNTSCKHPALLATQNVTAKRGMLSVPSPIPNAGLVKPTNPLDINQSQSTSVARLPRQGPASKKKPFSAVTNNKSITTKSTTPAMSRTSLQGPANPLTALHPASTYTTPKTSSPPNPLKGLPVEKGPVASASFPHLPSQISVVNEANEGISRSKDCHNAISCSSVKIKVEGTK